MEEKFNIAFNVVGHPSGQLFLIVQASLMGNGGEYDLIYPHPTAGMLNFLTNGLFQNLYSFVDENGEKIIHLDKPWWNQSQVYQFTIDKKLYIAVNDMSICGQGFFALVYNRDLYNELQLDEDLYSLVDNHEWTMAKLQELSMKYGEGAGADGILNEEDKLGLMFLWQSSPYWFCGGRVFAKNENDEFYVAIDTDQANKITKAYYNLLHNTEDHVYMVAEKHTYASFPTSKMLANFKEGNALFFSYDLGGLYKHLWNTSFDVGYLPNPLLDEAQDDYIALSAAGFFAIPQKVRDNKVSATVLEALAVHSRTNHRSNFFDDILLSRMSENPADYKMLERLHSIKTYDWGSHLIGVADSGSFIQIAVDNGADNASGVIRGRKRARAGLLDKIAEIRDGKFGG